MTLFFEEHPLARGLLGFFLLVFGLSGLAFVVVNLAKDVSLWVFGEQATAQIVDLWAERTGGDEAQPTFSYYMRYRFTTKDGRTISRTTRVAAAEWAGLGSSARAFDRAVGEVEEPSFAGGVYQEHQHVPEFGIGGMEEGATMAIVYFPPYPDHNRLDESRFIPALACAYVPLVFLSIVGLVAGWRLLRSALPGREAYAEVKGGDQAVLER
jgi:hypothetical protein